MFITLTRKKGKTHCIKSAEIRTSKSSVFGQFSRSDYRIIPQKDRTALAKDN